ncbi:aconitase X [Chloroflexota bacterium]
MKLTDNEKHMLEGEEGEARAWALDKLVKLGEYYGAPSMVDIVYAHLAKPRAGIDLTMLNLYDDMVKKGGKFKVTTSTNPEAFDFDKPEILGISQESIKLQERWSHAVLSMGAVPTRTCTMYWSGIVPRMGEHVAFNESSSIAYVNSVLGARTNTESQISALLSALTGKTPKMVYHLDENRRGNTLVKLEAIPAHLTEWDALGLHLTQVLPGDAVPVFTNMPQTVRTWELKRMNASLGYGLGPPIGLWHAAGITPEAATQEQAFKGEQPRAEVVVTPRDIQKVYELSEWHGPVDLIHFGCPHLSVPEMAMVASMFQSKRVSSNVQAWVVTSPAVKKVSDTAGYTAILEQAGVIVLSGMCCATLPKKEAREIMGGKVLVTDSGKHWNLAPSIMGDVGLRTILKTTEEVVTAAVTGRI